MIINGNKVNKMKLLFVVLFISVINAEKEANTTITQSLIRKVPKRTYVCPPDFIRLSHRCYFFSTYKATWQDAYFKCRELHSNLAVIKTANQDKLVRKTLSKQPMEMLERWIGGRYDWEQMTWKWAASGKSLSYQGFSQMESESNDELRWYCIIMDPALQFKWNTRSCLEEKNFICHTKIKIVTSKGRKKLLKQYRVNQTNKLNEISVPVLSEDAQQNMTILRVKDSSNINNVAAYAIRPKQHKKRTRRNKKKIIDYQKNLKQKDRPNPQKHQENNFPNTQMKWKTYYKDSALNPLHPKPIIEEFNYIKAT